MRLLHGAGLRPIFLQASRDPEAGNETFLDIQLTFMLAYKLLLIKT